MKYLALDIKFGVVDISHHTEESLYFSLNLFIINMAAFLSLSFGFLMLIVAWDVF